MTDIARNFIGGLVTSQLAEIASDALIADEPKLAVSGFMSAALIACHIEMGSPEWSEEMAQKLRIVGYSAVDDAVAAVRKQHEHEKV